MWKWRAVRRELIVSLMITMVGQGAHSGRHFRDSRACWTPSWLVSGRSPAVNGLHVLIIWPSVGPTLPVSPPSPGVSEETGPR